MTDSQDELLQRLNEMQAVRGIDDDTRAVIGMLCETITTLDEEISDLQQQVAEIEESINEYERNESEREKRSWYSER